MPVAGSQQPCTTHKARDPFAAVPVTTLAQIGVHAGRARGLARGGVHRLYTGKQRHVGLRMSGRRPVPPGVPPPCRLRFNHRLTDSNLGQSGKSCKMIAVDISTSRGQRCDTNHP